MIELSVEDYCHNCSQFEAKVDKDVFYGGNYPVCYRTKITCKHAEVCENIKNYLKKEADQ